MDSALQGDAPFGPWNPGLQSQIPDRLRPLSTIFRPENVFTDIDSARELRDLTGLDYGELVAFRPERLALHELLVRVTADISVPDGPKIEDLGINFRRITCVILAGYVEPRIDSIRSTYDAARKELSELIESELAALFPPQPVAPPEAPKSLFGFLRRRSVATPVPESAVGRERAIVAGWQAKALSDGAPSHKAAYRALARVVSALLVRHGELWGGRALISSLAMLLATNNHASDEIGRLLDSWVPEAANAEGYALLPRQLHPVVMNTKGASASGKSTLRPLQRKLAGDIGERWSEFALISPDIWRKQLLDYALLGAAYKYGGAFTGEELDIIDHKLDRYMARKAERGDMSHLLIDRFRFDSFAPDSEEAGSNLLTRFGQIVYLFFMITPPASLVERAWDRGLEFGRYKAVDDTLAHGVEAYSGIPHLFFTWVARTDKRVHFEFLDNSVRLGERPRTVAFGRNDVLNVLDVGCMLDIERYRKVNVDARTPQSLYEDKEVLAPDRNIGFLEQCVHKFREVNFADQLTGRIYLKIASGKQVWVDREALENAVRQRDTHAGLKAVAGEAFDLSTPAAPGPHFLSELAGAERIQTLGRWGTPA